MSEQHVSVPRELLERALSAIEQVGYQDRFIDYAFTGEVKRELCRTLAAPAEDVCAAVDEPVAFIHPHTLRRFWGPGAKEEVGHVVNKEDPHEECLPLFLQPQRQMVLPERKEILQVWEPCDEVEQIRNEGFNECLSLWQAELNK